jgi:hypothetical protein
MSIYYKGPKFVPSRPFELSQAPSQLRRQHKCFCDGLRAVRKLTYSAGRATEQLLLRRHPEHQPGQPTSWRKLLHHVLRKGGQGLHDRRVRGCLPHRYTRRRFAIGFAACMVRPVSLPASTERSTRWEDCMLNNALYDQFPRLKLWMHFGALLHRREQCRG